MIPTERIERLLEPAYTADLAGRDDDELREIKTQCTTAETTLSYYRRLAQGRIEILEAWRENRRSGGTLESLIADLPWILAPPSARPGTAQVRMTEAAPDVEPLDLGGRESLVVDDTLADLPSLDDATVAARLDELKAFEHDVSELRAKLHGVLDGVEHEIATRQAAGTIG